jgi:hypothetical protein
MTKYILYLSVYDEKEKEIKYENYQILDYDKTNRTEIIIKDIYKFFKESKLVEIKKFIKFIFFFDGVLDHNNKPVLLNKLEEEISIPFVSYCKSILKYKETYNHDMEYTTKKEHIEVMTLHNIYKNKDKYDYPLYIKDKYNNIITIVINTLNNKNKCLRYIITNNQKDYMECVKIINNLCIETKGGIIMEIEANNKINKLLNSCF